MQKDKKDKKDNVLISDSGLIDSGKNEKITRLFINICQLLSVILIILAILAFVKGNF